MHFQKGLNKNFINKYYLVILSTCQLILLFLFNGILQQEGDWAGLSGFGAEFLHVFDYTLATLKSVLPGVTGHLLKEFGWKDKAERVCRHLCVSAA